MDQIKIGKFIQEKRKEKKLTQSELAEKLNISDRAVSKWENGNCLPDAGTMPDLCKILNISISDLFSGEKVDMKDKEKKLEENLLEMVALKEENDKQLLHIEIIIGIFSVLMFLTIIWIAASLEMETWIRVLLIVIGTISFLSITSVAIYIEQKAGYYECSKCHNKYVPKYISVFIARHMGRTRMLKCPKCGTKCWHKKVISR